VGLYINFFGHRISPVAVVYLGASLRVKRGENVRRAKARRRRPLWRDISGTLTA
jgi:hypothetical protein